MMSTIDARYITQANNIVRVIPHVLRQRGLESYIQRCVITQTPQGATWLFTVMDTSQIQRLELYESPDLLHQISTVLRGRPVLISNHSGLRYAVLMSSRPSLPKSLPYPGWFKGMLQIGAGYKGAIETTWADLGHVLAAGATGSGKSNLLKLIVNQAAQEGLDMILSDLDGRTFPHMADYSHLLAPLDYGLDGCTATIEAAVREMNRRVDLYNSMPGYHDSLDAYNAHPQVNEPLSRLLVVVDEVNSLIMSSGGPGGGVSKMLADLAHKSRKYGMNLVLAGQTFNMAYVGPMRDQMTTRICFRVNRASTARVVLGESGAEHLRTPGRAYSDRPDWGLIQTYQAPPPSEFISEADGLTSSERVIVERIRSQFGGRVTYEVLRDTFGMSRGEADKLRAAWEKRGIAEIRRDQNNAFCLR